MPGQLKRLIPAGVDLMRVEMFKGGGLVELEFADGTILHGEPDGDCCSESWVEHLDVCGVGSPVVSVDQVDMGEIDHPDDDDRYYDCLWQYQTTIRTAKGLTIIEYRNNSNGYYGGWLNWSINKTGTVVIEDGAVAGQ